ncbi:hypothetical protein TSL6_09700 [Sulfurovum sp. TSL6]|uniref:hypothetical protein n=1 Tax=Sulfurovum sp. TSL6 TaxID=2826995 RepID=UPI001CC51474|nr:hypothetical protein [Sulfurovum sp. TSL6]GIU00464.1 hypothetical protein TSL6_09700 [Sulfurovum sp. TSL6]
MPNNKILSGYCALNICNNVIYAAKGYKIFKSFDGGKSWEIDGKIEDLKYSLIANTSRLLARLFRTEITYLLILQDGSRVAIGKKGIFVAQKNEKIYRKTFNVSRGTRPLNMCEDSKGYLYFGEYLSNPDREEVHIFKSIDSGKTWTICHTFPKSTIRHVHGIFYDKYEDLLWFATGDLDGECIIGYTNDSFETVKIFKHGGQKYRAVQLLFFKDFIIYGTDTEYDKNYIYRLDRKNGKEHCLQELQGSVLSSVNSDEYAAISTAVEPSEVNHDIYSYIWFSNDGYQWKELYKGKKDSLNPKYFQYGRFKFPIGAINNEEILFSGHALERLDNKTIIYSLTLSGILKH